MQAFQRLLILLILLSFSTFFSYTQEIQPTDDEQLMLELINRARMNPAEEGIRLANHTDINIQGAINFFGVDVDAIVQDFSTYPSRPPLAMNLQLIQASRRHSGDLYDNNFQGHTGTDGSNVGDRVTDTGYLWRQLGENVFSYGRSIEHAHAGFVVDWGVPSLGHRNNTLEFESSPVYTEIGIGIIEAGSLNAKVANGSSGLPKAPGVSPSQSSAVGPLLVTIVFGTSFSPEPKVLGVVYDDLNEDGFYNPGEGKGSINVRVIETGLSTTTYHSGGYDLEISSPGTYTLEISGNGISTVQKTFEMSQENVKVDFTVTEPVSVPNWMMY